MSYGHRKHLTLPALLTLATAKATASTGRRVAGQRGNAAAGWRAAPRVLDRISSEPGAFAAAAVAAVVAGWAASLFLVGPPWFQVAEITLACYLVLAVVGRIAGRAPAAPPAPEHPWSAGRLEKAMRHVGILDPGKPATATDPGRPAETLHPQGPPVHDDHGTTVRVKLPGGRTIADVRARLTELASVLEMRAGDLGVTQTPDDHAGIIRFYFTDQAAQETAGQTIYWNPPEAPHRVDWRTPIRIGRTPRGEPVTLATFEHNVLVGGVPGFGKTNAVRIVVAHALLAARGAGIDAKAAIDAGRDPYTVDRGAEVHVLDGKGSVGDWGDVRGLLDTLILGASDEDPVGRLQVLLDGLLATVQARNAGTDTAKHWVLFVADELQDIRAAADKKTRDRLDATLGRVVRMGRAVGVTIVVSTQRPSVLDLPSGVRNLVDQTLALVTRPGDDKLILGSVPPDGVRRPEKRGEAILGTPAGMVPVILDHLTDDWWKWLAAHGRPVGPAPTPTPEAPRESPREATGGPEPAPRPAPAPRATTTRTKATEAPTEPIVLASVDPLLAAVLTILADAEGQELPPVELWTRLPEAVQPGHANQVGRMLKPLGLVKHRPGGGRPDVYRFQDALAAAALGPDEAP